MNQYLAWYILIGIPTCGYLFVRFSPDERSREAIVTYLLVLFAAVTYPITLLAATVYWWRRKNYD